MPPFGWLLGLLLPACGAAGAHGLPSPRLMDITRIERPASPNTALAAPAGFRPKPDIIVPDYPLPAARLLDILRAVAAQQPRTFLAAAYPAERQLDWVVRSLVFNFPDLVTAEVLPRGTKVSTVVLYSRSVYGYSDLGVNHQRLTAWLTALDDAVSRQTAGK